MGDRYCGPIQYFDFPFEIDEDIPPNIFKVIDDYDYIIFGGGGHIHIPSPDYNEGRFGHLEILLPYAPKIINWGIGHNVGYSEMIEYPDYMEKFLLNGFRDVQRQGIDWVACPSCMHTAFDRSYAIEDDFRVFNKPGKMIQGIFHGMEDAQGLTLTETVEFLGGADTVITNSYHGAYWGLLLGRKVVVSKPDSSKFFGLVEGCERVGRSDLALSSPAGYLDSCRKSNEDFFDKVVKKIS